MSLESTDEQTSLPTAAVATPPLRTWYGEERRRLFAPRYDGLERRLADPLTEQDEDREPPPN